MVKLFSRIATLAVAICLGGFSWWYFKKGPVGASDGLPLSILLPVSHFAQGNLQWGGEFLAGNPHETLARAGCAVTSAAMVLAYKGMDIDPARLNSFLTALPGGYVGHSWIEWYKAAEYDPRLTASLLPHYEDAPSRFYLDWNLLRGNPVIIRVASRHPSPHALTHFMVVVGKSGRDYIVQDPGTIRKEPYPLKNYGPQIDAIRFYNIRSPTSQ